MGCTLYSNGGDGMNLELRRKFMIAVEEAPAPAGRLPAEYQEVEYVTIKNDAEYDYKNKISLKNGDVPISISFDQVDTIEFKGSIPAQRSYSMLFSGWAENGNGISPFIYANLAGIMADSGGDIEFTPTSTATFDGNPFTITLNNLKTTTTYRYITFGAWNDATYSPTMNWYYVKMSKDGVAVVDLVPCYRKSDNAVGFYDLVSDKFIPPHTASDEKAFIPGGKV